MAKQQISTIYNHYFYVNLYKYQKSRENTEITLYCIKVTIKTVESSFITSFLLSQPINFDIKMHAKGGQDFFLADGNEKLIMCK